MISSTIYTITNTRSNKWSTRIFVNTIRCSSYYNRSFTSNYVCIASSYKVITRKRFIFSTTYNYWFTASNNAIATSTADKRPIIWSYYTIITTTNNCTVTSLNFIFNSSTYKITSRWKVTINFIINTANYCIRKWT